MNGLYAIIDAETLVAAGLSIERFAAAVARARPGAMQLRDKRLGSAEHLRLLQGLREICTDAEVPLFANDRADLALAAGCDGVHLGQQDLPPTDARRLADDAGRTLRVGMSVHNAEELAVALAQGPDYIALGPVFDTRSKANPDPTLGTAGLATLARATREAFAGPRVAIGGIDADSAATVAGTCEMVAVIGALVDRAAVERGGDAPYAEATARAECIGRAFAEARGGAS